MTPDQERAMKIVADLVDEWNYCERIAAELLRAEALGIVNYGSPADLIDKAERLEREAVELEGA